MSLKIHFLHFHLDFFPDSLGDISDEQREGLHQDLQKIEKSYQGFWDEGILSDYCWFLIRETDQNNYKRRSSTELYFEFWVCFEKNDVSLLKMAKNSLIIYLENLI